jgi:hypothetical protein
VLEEKRKITVALLPDVEIVVEFTQITCTTPAGYGANLQVAIIVNGTTSYPSDLFFSYYCMFISVFRLFYPLLVTLSLLCLYTTSS